MRKAIALWGAAIATLLGVAAPALSSYETIHKVEEGGKTKVYFPGTPGSQTTFQANAAPSVRQLTVNYCGWIKVTEGASIKVVSIAGTNISGDIFSGGGAFTSAPSCNHNGSTWVNTSYALGKAWRNGSDIWVRVAAFGATNGLPYAATIVYKRDYKVNIKECGFGYTTVSATKPMSFFVVGSGSAAASYQLTAIPTTTRPMICKLMGSQKRKYIPASGF